MRSDRFEIGRKEVNWLQRKVRALIVHNFPTPYRLELFDDLMRDVDLSIQVLFTVRPGVSRPTWSKTWIEDDRRIRFLPGIGIPIHGKFEDRIYLNFGIARLLERRPDVVLLFGYSDPTNLLLSALCARRGIPYILFAEVSYEWGRGIVSRLARPITRFMIRNASFLIPASESAASFFRELGGAQVPTVVVPCVPDIDKLTARREQLRGARNDLLTEFGLLGRFIILYVGRLQPYKGIKELLEAVEMIVDRAPRLRLVIIGTGPMKDFVERECAKDQDHLLYMGGVDQETLHKLYSISDIHIMPSWAEAFGVVCPEALAFGIPSVVTRTSGCSDLIEDGINGFLIDPKSPESIARAIVRAYNDPELLNKMKTAAADKSLTLGVSEIVAPVKDAILTAAKRQAPHVDKWPEQNA